MICSSPIWQGVGACRSSPLIQSSTNTLNVAFTTEESGFGAQVFCPYDGDCTVKCVTDNGTVACSSNITYAQRAWWSTRDNDDRTPTTIHFSKDTNLNIIPKSCGPNAQNRDINVCPKYERYTTSKDEYMQMIKLIEEQEVEMDIDYDMETGDHEGYLMDIYKDEDDEEFLSAFIGDELVESKQDEYQFLSASIKELIILSQRMYLSSSFW